MIVSLSLINVVGIKESAGLNIALAVVDFFTQLLLVIVGAVLIFSPQTLAENISFGVAPTWTQFLLAIPLSTTSHRRSSRPRRSSLRATAAEFTSS
ncbi:MAG: hypothetical protein LC777_04420 [Actinobacteria bacterium]|nr:hypothetical protein [Actinomycetota bacterium]